ncbi:MAG TPA: M20/M25/M40 family metallo-hydrolase [Gaiellaceae bacterium]|nr:M20/M25/M40 family metallo-hydrolase [Gaiellaceae bacterium]
MKAAWLEELREFIAIPSVSADPAHRDDVRRAGEWVVDLVKRAGGEAELVPFGERELVLGDIPATTDGANAPTVLVYGHFDVQPPAPLDEWESPPFELDVRDGWAYGRGVADDKGLLYTVLKAAELLVRGGGLPVNLRIASDGEEEIGGHTVVEFLEQDARSADACMIFDGGPFRAEQPEFAIATRGLVGFHVKVRTGARDLHSGLYGGAALNAQHALMQGLTALMARDGKLPEPLRQGIAPVTGQERSGWAALPAGADLLREAGASPLDPRAADEFYERTWAEPSMDVNGIRGGKPDFVNTTLVVQADARFTIRLAPGQDTEAIATAAEHLLREAIPSGAQVEVERENSSPPGLFPPDSRVIQLGLDAFERAVGRRPILVRSGGTLPIVPALAAKGIDTVVTGFALPQSNVHSPNERLRVEDFDRSIAAAQGLYTTWAQLA